MAQNAFENNQSFELLERGINIMEVVRENVRMQLNRQKMIVCPATRKKTALKI